MFVNLPEARSTTFSGRIQFEGISCDLSPANGKEVVLLLADLRYTKRKLPISKKQRRE